MAQIKDLKRMCEFLDDCSKCEFFEPSYTCGVYFLSDNADKIVDKWVKEHPVKTYAMDFFEKFPNAPKDKDGKPKTCIKTIYSDVGVSCSFGTQSCAKCWEQEMKGNA